MPQCSWKALREENATPAPVHPHQNTWKFEKCQGNFKIELCSRFQKKILARLHVSFLSWWKRMEKQGKKQFIKQNEVSLFLYRAL